MSLCEVPHSVRDDKWFAHEPFTFAAMNETAKRVSPVPLLPNPISHVRRSGRAPPQEEDRRSLREFPPARRKTILPFHWAKQFSQFGRRAPYECGGPFLLPIAFVRQWSLRHDERPRRWSPETAPPNHLLC